MKLIIFLIFVDGFYEGMSDQKTTGKVRLSRVVIALIAAEGLFGLAWLATNKLRHNTGRSIKHTY